ncbi:DUF975 family protein [Clostridiaceae bacterium OttesenSCG-928-D20]|nr:DUF975 family protein [Clostridiaceae bacterium OttesenSCG-928-D20]
MEINRAAIKANAKNQIKEAKPSPIAMTFLMLVLPILGTVFLVPIAKIGDGLFSIVGTSNYSVFRVLFAIALVLAFYLVMFLFAAGYQKYCLDVSRYIHAGLNTFFECFSFIFKIIALCFLIGIFVYLWTILLVIPGIIAAYRYRMAFFILLDNPHLSALDCINESKRMMDGRKMELFILDLSFIGWALLGAIPYIGWLFMFFVSPYMVITQANYYNALLGLEDIRQTRNGYTPPREPAGEADCIDHEDSHKSAKSESWQGGKPPWEM